MAGTTARTPAGHLHSTTVDIWTFDVQLMRTLLPLTALKI
jgi:hypothetical protein